MLVVQEMQEILLELVVRETKDVAIVRERRGASIKTVT